jgi:glycosyltransferase involved in cell wall biosynthesis
VRILTVVSTFPPHSYGGGEISAMNLSKWLAKQGHEVGVVTVADKDERELRGEIIEGLRVWRLHFPRPYTFWSHVKASNWQKPWWYLQDHFDPRNRTLMAYVLDAFKPDCVDVQVITGIGYNALREIGRRKIPTVYFLHDLNLACLWGGMFKNGKICSKRCLECRIASHLRFSDLTSIPFLAFCSPSRANLAKVASVLPLEKYQTASIFNANIYPPPTVSHTKADHVRFLFVGRLDKSKGIDLLLSVLENLAQKYRFTIDLLGDGAQAEGLRVRFGHHDWCHFKGHVSQEEVANYMVRSDVLCTPSIWAEPLGGVVVQAVLIGLPVLGSDIGGIPELIDHDKSGLLIPANDSTAWEAAIRSVLDVPAQLVAWGSYAKANSQKLDQDINGQKIITFFEEFMAATGK